MKKKKIYLSLILIIVFIIIVRQALIDHEDYIADYGESQIYTKEDMQQAMKVIQKKFAVGSMHSSKLLRITYSGDKESQSRGETYGHDKAMAFYIDFHSPKSDNSAGPLNPDQDYKNYHYLLFLTSYGKWVIDSSACGYG